MDVTQPRSVSSFWTIVRRCLVTFYGVDEQGSRSRVAVARKQLLSGGARINSPYSLFYHAEPIDVAIDLMNAEVPAYDAQFLKQYRSIKESVDGPSKGHAPAHGRLETQAADRRADDQPRAVVEKRRVA